MKPLPSQRKGSKVSKGIAEELLVDGVLNHSSYTRALGLDSRKLKDKQKTKEEYDAALEYFADSIEKDGHNFVFAKEAKASRASSKEVVESVPKPPQAISADQIKNTEKAVNATEKVAKEYPKGYRAFRYHDEECPEGQIFTGSKITEMEARGWHD
jgi:hypothetical protein